MSKRKNQPIAENLYVKELLATLQANQSPGRQEFIEIISHVTETEQRLADAVNELKVMCQDLGEIQKNSQKTSLQKSIITLQSCVIAMRDNITELKSKIIEGCKNAMAEFKAQGAVALDGIAHFFHIRPALESLRKNADNSIRLNDKAIAKIEAFSAEYHEAGRHVKNMGRTLRGKETVQEAKNTGPLAKMLQAPYRTERDCMMSVKKSVDKALDSLSRLEQSAQRKPSLLKAVQENVEKVQPPQERPAPAMDHSGR